MTSKRYRYPGSKPFEERERALFFGRDEDIDMLSRMIRVEPLVVLYGKSGLGKSSLLNAGVVPALAESGEYEVLPMRFGSYSEGSKQYAPLDQLTYKLKNKYQGNSFLDKLSISKDSLWYKLKDIQLSSQNHKAFVIVFDQFEELFTYPEREVRRFKESLVDVLNSALPQEVRKMLKVQMQSNSLSLTKEEMAMLYDSLKVHLVFAIRSDKMSLMNRLRDYIPNILQRVYELRALNREQAEDAILSPAEIKNADDLFYSPSFDYEDEALDKILDFLTKGNEKSIESFQLQILCQHVEENLVIKEFDTLISPDDIGDLEHIYQNYYDNQIEKLEDEAEQERARKLIEEGLIFEEEERRLSMYEGQIRNSYGISDDLLRKLADTHLIRSEPHSTGGFSYEISHDTLVGPILKSKERRQSLQEEQRKIEEEKARQKQLQLEQRKNFMRRLRIAGLIIISLVAGIVILEVVRELNQASDLEETADRLRKALAEADSFKVANDKLAQTTQGELLEKIEMWKTRYYDLADSMAAAPQDSLISIADSVAVHAKIHTLTTERDEWKQRYRSLLNRSSKEKYLYSKRLKELNKALFDELWKTEYKSNQEWINLKDGIIQQYKDFEKELE